MSKTQQLRQSDKAIIEFLEDRTQAATRNEIMEATDLRFDETGNALKRLLRAGKVDKRPNPLNPRGCLYEVLQ